MSDNYKYDLALIQDSVGHVSSMFEELHDILVMGESLKGKIESYDGWKGKQKEELISFLNLLISYHQELVEKSDNPFIQYKQAFEELTRELDSYKSISKSYKELNSKC